MGIYPHDKNLNQITDSSRKTLKYEVFRLVSDVVYQFTELLHW